MTGKKSGRLIPDVVTVGKGRAPFSSPPIIASIPEPKYPEVSRRHGEEGVVMLSVAIDERGRGGEIEVLSSSGYGRLDRAAISALKRARFVPANESGRAVSSVKKIAIRFSLK
jgi:protein TonB